MQEYSEIRYVFTGSFIKTFWQVRKLINKNFHEYAMFEYPYQMQTGHTIFGSTNFCYRESNVLFPYWSVFCMYVACVKNSENLFPRLMKKINIVI